MPWPPLLHSSLQWGLCAFEYIAIQGGVAACFSKFLIWSALQPPTKEWQISCKAIKPESYEDWLNIGNCFAWFLHPVDIETSRQSESFEEESKSTKRPIRKVPTAWREYTCFETESRMWVNVLLFLMAVATAAYLYIRRNVGWFKSRGIYENEFVFPYGSSQVKKGFRGEISFSMVTREIYEK